MKKYLLFILLAVYWPLAQADVKLQVDANEVQLGDSFNVMLTMDGAQANNIPDLTPLEENFEIVGTQRSNSYTIINGQSQSNSQWIITLNPRKPGQLVIPALPIGTEKTSAVTITVTASKPANTKQINNKDILLTTDVSDKKPFVNQEIIYTVKLYNSTRLLDAQYQPPEVEDALLIPLGNGNSTQTMVNGKLYSVEEQHYAIFPQKSGKLKIKPPMFNALIYDGSPRKVHIQADESDVTIQPIPPRFQTQAWLPAKQVNLSESYDKPTQSMLQGNTLTRTVTLEVVGVPAQLLPNLEFNNNQGQLGVYPEKPTTKNVIRQSDIVGTSTVRVTYLLNKAGNITIPELRLPWFNIRTGKEETATLPALTINVAAVNNNNNQVSSNTPNLKPLAGETSTAAATEPKRAPITQPKYNFSSAFAWWLAALFAVLWLGTMLFWWRAPAKNLSKKQLLNQIKKACEQNDPAAAQAALLQWANWRWPDRTILSLGDISQLTTNMAFKKELNDLAKILYSKNNQTWQGQSLWQCVLAQQAIYKRKQAKPDLPSLYPNNKTGL